MNSNRSGRRHFLQSAAHQRGATIFVVAHDARIVPHADRVCYLQDGCLQTDQVTNSPHPGAAT